MNRFKLGDIVLIHNYYGIYENGLICEIIDAPCKQISQPFRVKRINSVFEFWVFYENMCKIRFKIPNGLG
jgi:hypothetical protein